MCGHIVWPSRGLERDRSRADEENGRMTTHDGIQQYINTRRHRFLKLAVHARARRGEHPSQKVEYKGAGIEFAVPGSKGRTSPGERAEQVI